MDLNIVLLWYCYDCMVLGFVIFAPADVRLCSTADRRSCGFAEPVHEGNK